MLETPCPRDQRGFTKAVTLELVLDQRAGICQVGRDGEGFLGRVDCKFRVMEA